MPERQTRFLEKNNDNDIIWWVNDYETVGVWEFTFDKEHYFNMFRDYPWRLSPEQKEIFDRENPFWADFFSDREYHAAKS